MTASTTTWLLSPTKPVPPQYPNQGRWLSQLLIARTQLLQKAAKRHSPKAFQEMRWIGNTDALLAPTCGTSPARGRLTLLGAGLIGVPAKVRAGTHCRSALELLHSTKALPVQLDQPRPLEETRLLSTKGALVPEKVKPPTPSKTQYIVGRWEGIQEAEHSHPRWVSSPANSFGKRASITATGRGLRFASPLKEEVFDLCCRSLSP